MVSRTRALRHMTRTHRVLSGFFHGKRHSFPEFFPRFHSIPFSSGVIRSGSYNNLGAATDSWSRTCSLPTYDFSVPAANLKRLPPSPPRFCVSVVSISPVSTQCPATMLSLLSSRRPVTDASPRYSQWRGCPSPFSCANFGIAPALVSEGKSKKSQVAPDPEKK